ncbi:MAG: RDD family protein [Acidobacteriaceae bacterium]|nr:RDD family protein [Acidobacteriaceae bacterium]
MDWYYADSGRQIGPLDETAIRQLAAQGGIRPDTLVWHPGLPNWLPYRNVQVVAAPVASSPYQAAAPAVAPVADTRYCAECGRQYAASEMVAFGAAMVCANCKPAYAQKLREGVLSTGRFTYGGFWIRFGAVLIDGIILWVVNLIPSILIFGATGFGRMNTAQDLSRLFATEGILILISLGLGFTYETVFIGKFGATPGKMVCRLKVVNADGTPVTMQKAAARWAAKLISSFTLLIGYIMAAFDEEKRALHDRICDTRVIVK